MCIFRTGWFVSAPRERGSTLVGLEVEAYLTVCPA